MVGNAKEIFGALLTLLVVVPIFIATNWYPYKLVSTKIRFWPYVAFPCGAAAPWLLLVLILYFKFPPNPDPSKEDFGILPLLGFLVLFTVPIYYGAMAIGSMAFLEEATVLRRFLMSAFFVSILLAPLVTAVYFIKFRGQN